MISFTSSTRVSKSSSSTSSSSTSSPSIFVTIVLPGFASTGGLTPSAASRLASNSALVGNSILPEALGADFFAPLLSAANFCASSSAFVGKRRGPADFLTIFFTAAFFVVFFTAVFFATTFLVAAFFTVFLLLALFFCARIPATIHPLVCLASDRASETCLAIL
ncbi:unannotated protein [freshwater metagenome]|uniref:Unannotated protein n=1 Tax=freshwater metagenome TaxID=449393 RepID=A0A6J6HJ40_9ZZZZ